MKLIKYSIYTLLTAALFYITGCEDHRDGLLFTDDLAYVAWGSNAVSLQEEGGEQSVSIHLASASGLSSNVTIEVVAGQTTAVEGVDYTIDTYSASFTRDAPIYQFRVNVIDNDVYAGNKRLVLRIGDPSNKGVGTLTDAERLCTITIIDDEHPWKALFGNYIMTADNTNPAYGTEEYAATVSASDNDDPNIISLLINYPYDVTDLTPVEMEIIEKDDELLISIATIQYFGKYGSYNVYLSWLYLEGGSRYYSTTEPIKGKIINGVIVLDDSNGLGLLAYSGSTIAGWVDSWTQGTISFAKQ